MALTISAAIIQSTPASLDLIALAEAAAKLSPAAMFALAILGVIKRWWVPGWLYKQVLTERDEWKHTALELLEENRQNTATAREATAVAARVVGRS